MSDLRPMWANRRRYKNGAVGMMMHAIPLHGKDYSVEMDSREGQNSMAILLEEV